MKVVHYDPKFGELKLQVDTLDDMWHLEKVLCAGDEIEANTTRTYKVGTREEKKHVKIRVKAENIEFSKNANRLRVLGPIIWGEPEEFIQLGKYHTIEVAEGERIRIVKKWKKHELDRLRDAEKESKKPRLRIIVLDDEKALNAVLRTYGVEYGAEFYASSGKKSEGYEKAREKYFDTIMDEIDRHPEKYVVAGPGFARENLKSYINKKNPLLLKRIVFEVTSDAERSGVNELFEKGVIEKIVGEERFDKEMKLVAELIKRIYKNDALAAYGITEVKKAAAASAVEKLLILDEYLRTNEEGEAVVDLAEKNGSEIVIFSSEGDAGAKLKGLGKIAALLRFRIKE